MNELFGMVVSPGEASSRLYIFNTILTSDAARECVDKYENGEDVPQIKAVYTPQNYDSSTYYSEYIDNDGRLFAKCYYEGDYYFVEIYNKPEDLEEVSRESHIEDIKYHYEFKVDDYTATIEQNDYDENGRITLVVSSTFNMTNVIPKIIWQGKTLTPNESTTQDLNTGIIYTVEAESGRTKSYDVVVCYIPDEPIIADDIAIITKFNIGDYSTTITQNNNNEIGVIEASIPENVDISNIIPEITWEGIKLEPNDNELQDFTQDNIVYTVTAESGRNKIYEIHITRIPNSNPDTGIESPWNILRWSFIIILSGGVICFVNKRRKEF